MGTISWILRRLHENMRAIAGELGLSYRGPLETAPDSSAATGVRRFLGLLAPARVHDAHRQGDGARPAREGGARPRGHRGRLRTVRRGGPYPGASTARGSFRCSPTRMSRSASWLRCGPPARSPSRRRPPTGRSRARWRRPRPTAGRWTWSSRSSARSSMRGHFPTRTDDIARQAPVHGRLLEKGYRDLRRTVTQFVTADPPTLKETPISGGFREGTAPMGSPISCL